MNKLLERLSIEQKIGQLFMAPFHRDQVDGQVMNLITNHYIGGVLLQDTQVQHIKKIAHLTNYLQRFAGNDTPLFIATSQEAVEKENNRQLTTLPKQRKLGEINNRVYTKQITEVVASEQRALGINMIFSPNLQANTNDEKSYSDDLDKVSKHGIETIQGFMKERVLSVVRGITTEQVDPLKPVDRPKSELYPFYKAIQRGLDAIHLAEVDEEVIKENIEHRLQFTGILTYEISSHIENINEAVSLVLKAIDAGVHLLILPTKYDMQVNILNNVVETLKTDKSRLQRVDNLLLKIFSIKTQYKMNELIDFDESRFNTRFKRQVVEKIEKKWAVVNSN